MRHRNYLCIASFVLLLVASSVAHAGDILQQVPNDALGFVIIHKINAFDGKVSSLSSDLRNSAFSPLGFLNTITGIRDGLDPNGDFMLVAYNGGSPDKPQRRFAVWLPVADYARFIKSIGATSVDGVVTAKIAGEDLLIAHRGDWAIVMDPDERQRIVALASASPSPPPQVVAWQQWVDSNEITVVALTSGVHELLSWADEAAENGLPGSETSDDIFGANGAAAHRDTLVATSPARSPSDVLAALLSGIHKWTATSPAFAQAVQQANMAGCGLRLNLDGNQGGNVQAKFRIAFEDAIDAEQHGTDVGLPFSIYNNGGFVMYGAGQLPKTVLIGLTSAYLQKFADELKKEEHIELEDDSLKQLNDALVEAAADIRSAAVLDQPGAKPQPAFTNEFLVVRVASASEFVNHAAEVVRIWNKANREAQTETRLILEGEEVKVGARSATQYSIDMTAAAGEPVLPEIRQAMERLFGAGGKLRIWIVPADNNTVLLAQATAEQVTAALKAFDRKQTIDLNKGDVIECNRLLSTDSTWRLFFDQHRYNDWANRMQTASAGVPVIGGPLVKPFRESPPIGIAGSFHGSELAIEVAAMEPTVKSAYDYLMSLKPRPEVRPQPVQRRLQRTPR